MNYGIALRTARAALNLSREQLAELAGVGGATIARIEDGKDFKMSIFLKLCKAMPGIKFTDTDAGFVMEYKEMPSEADYLAAMGPCGK